MPKKSKSAFKQVQSDINHLEKVLERGRMSGYKKAKGINKALYNDLLGVLGGRSKRLTGFQERTLAHMAALEDRLNKSGRRGVARAQEESQSYGGGMYAPLFQGSTKKAQALAQRDSAQAEALGQFGEATAATGQGLLQLMESGVEEAQAGAQYETSRALAIRTQEDVAAVAQQQLQLNMMRLQHQLALEQARTEFRRSKKLEEFRAELASKYAEGTTGSSKPADAARFLASAAQRIMMMKAQLNPETGMTYTPTEMVAAIAAEYGVQAESADHRALGQLVTSLLHNTPGQPDDAVAEIMAILRTIQGWGKLDSGKKRPIEDLIRSVFESETLAAVSTNLQDAESVEDDEEFSGIFPSLMREFREGFGDTYDKTFGKLFDFLF